MAPVLKLFCVNCLLADSMAFNKGRAPVCFTVLFFTGAIIPRIGPISTPIPALLAVINDKAYSDAKIDSEVSPIFNKQQELNIFNRVRTPLIIGVGKDILSSLRAVYIFMTNSIQLSSKAKIVIAISINVS